MGLKLKNAGVKKIYVQLKKMASLNLVPKQGEELIQKSDVIA